MHKQTPSLTEPEVPTHFQSHYRSCIVRAASVKRCDKYDNDQTTRQVAVFFAWSFFFSLSLSQLKTPTFSQWTCNAWCPASSSSEVDWFRVVLGAHRCGAMVMATMSMTTTLDDERWRHRLWWSAVEDRKFIGLRNRLRGSGFDLGSRGGDGLCGGGTWLDACSVIDRGITVWWRSMQAIKIDWISYSEGAPSHREGG